MTDLLGKIGGLNNSIQSFIKIFMMFFMERLLYSSLLKRIYQVDISRESKIKQAIKDQKKMK